MAQSDKKTRSLSSSSQTEQVTCKKCSKSFASSNAIECDKCHTWFHPTCVGLTNPESQTISKLERKGVFWCCPDCNAKPIFDTCTEDRFCILEDKLDAITINLAKINQQSLEENKRQEKTFVDIVKQNVEKIEKQYDVFQEGIKVDLHTLRQNSTDANKLLKTQAEYMETEKRKNSAITHGVPEDTYNEFLKAISYPSEKIIQTFRLGKKNESGKPRPLKLVFVDEVQKWDFIKRVNNEKPRGVFATLDLTREEREEEFKTRELARNLRTENPSETYKIKNGKIYNVKEGSWNLCK